MKIRFLTLARHEVDDAVLWYEQQVEGLSQEFLDELDRVVRLVRIYQLMATQIEPEIRRFLFTRFSLFTNLWNRSGDNRRHCRSSPAPRAAILGSPNRDSPRVTHIQLLASS